MLKEKCLKMYIHQIRMAGFLVVIKCNLFCELTSFSPPPRITKAQRIIYVCVEEEAHKKLAMRKI
jgi:hypothetical protein